ncbi:hypothetical protein [Streptomyces mirabilis]|uniref:hypothetical protein n=1 Tax=Streptomyces mirabilis TaxID=68239 RepID=UPI003F4D9548
MRGWPQVPCTAGPPPGPRRVRARSHIQVARELAGHGYPREAGPGVYDIHSPRTVIASGREMSPARIGGRT